MTTIESTAAGAGTLRTGALHVLGIVMQNMANIAPAIASLFTIQQIASYAGATAPLAYLLAFGVSLCLGIVLAQLIKHLPSSGSYFTFISRAIHPRLGFLAAWLYFLTFPLVGAQAGTFMGKTLETTLKDEYGFNFPWWLFAILALAFTAAACYPGVTVGVGVLFVMTVIEFVLVLALALTGIVDPGPGGFNVDGFNPSHAPAIGTFYLAVTFAIFALTGWDAAAPMAEESAHPRTTVGRGVIVSILVMGAFLTLVSWGLELGWGTSNLQQFVDSEELPAFVTAHRVWGSAWLLVLIALVNSTLAVLISSMNASTRMWYRMARGGALPAWLGYVHPRFRTPTYAILAQTVLSLVLAFALSAVWGVENVFSVLGFLFIFGAIPVWALANLAVFRLYRREHPDEFSPLLHVVVPVVGTIGLVWFGYKSIYPLPPYPNSWAPPIVAAWLVIGVVVLVWMRAAGREQLLMERAGQAFDETAPVE